MNSSVHNVTIDQVLQTVVSLQTRDDVSEFVESLTRHGYYGDLGEWRTELEFNEHSQDRAEFAQMLDVIRGSHSLLEVGSRFGGTLRRMAEVLAPKSRVTCVDLPMVDGMTLDPAPSLRANCRRIAAMGHHVEMLLADSTDPETVRRVALAGPYDFCFIDGDHSYEGVKSDWENYGPMAKIVGFHDIINPPSQVDRLWAEIKPHYRHMEFTDSRNGHQLGIGIIFR